MDYAFSGSWAVRRQIDGKRASRHVDRIGLAGPFRSAGRAFSLRQKSVSNEKDYGFALMAASPSLKTLADKFLRHPELGLFSFTLPRKRATR